MPNISIEALSGQIVIGLINGSFYALVSVGLSIVLGLLHIANFFHGVQFMLGAFFAWLFLQLQTTIFGVSDNDWNYWVALVLVPPVVVLIGIAFEKLFFRRLYEMEHMYGFLLTLGAVLVVEGALIREYGTTGLSYPTPTALQGGLELGVTFVPYYRLWIVAASIVVCSATWYLVERTQLGAKLRAATENPRMVRAFGINVTRLITLAYGGGAALAAFAGVLAAPIYQFNPVMGSSFIIVIFAVVVIGGLGSVLGSIIAGYLLGLIEGLTKALYPEAASTVIFVFMALVLVVRPAGIMGRTGSDPLK